jgi:hypothetical protein
VVKWRESATPTLELDEEDEKQRQQVVVGLGEGEHGGAAKKQGKQQTTVVHAYEAVKAIDQDLYHIPPDMLCHEPRVSRPSFSLIVLHVLHSPGYCINPSWRS